MFEQWLGVPGSFTKHILILYIEDRSLKWLCLPSSAERRERGDRQGVGDWGA